MALRCLEWIDKYGDLDGDGFQEYQVRNNSRYGIENQGWKDSGNAIVYPDGAQVQAPKALCELQGYVFDAWIRMAEVFEVLGESEFSRELSIKAAKLRERFEERFWCEDIGFYAFALDKDKQPVKTITSNVGHCLWSGIIRPERAQQVKERLFAPDMWSGWGIRTLSTQNPAYNPFSYHLGSVWPHDNSIIALGLKRYGFSKEVASVAKGIFEAGSFFSNYRLPELYAGVKREPGSFPAPYLALLPHPPRTITLCVWCRDIRRPLPDGFKLKQVSVTKKADGWYMQLTMEDTSVPEFNPDLITSHLAPSQQG